MAWQQYQRNRYYSKSRRVEGQVRRQYIGGGLAGRLAATLDAQIAEERARLLEAYQTLRGRAEELAGLSRQFEQLAELVTGAALVAEGLGAAGHHLWRHRPNLRCLAPDMVDLGLVEQLRDLLRQARRRRLQAVADLEGLLEGPEVWATLAGLEERSRGLCLELLAGGSPRLQQQFTDEARRLATELAGPSPSRVLGLFARRASLAWLEVRTYAEALGRLQGLTVYRPRFLLKHQDEARRRYQAAARGLGSLKSLESPAAERQDR